MKNYQFEIRVSKVDDELCSEDDDPFECWQCQSGKSFIKYDNSENPLARVNIDGSLQQKAFNL